MKQYILKRMLKSAPSINPAKKIIILNYFFRWHGSRTISLRTTHSCQHLLKYSKNLLSWMELSFMDGKSRWVGYLHFSKRDGLRPWDFGGQNCRKSDLLPKTFSFEKFVRRKFCTPLYFVHWNLKPIKFDTKIMLKQIFIVNCMGRWESHEKKSLDKTAENSTWCRKFRPPKNYVRRSFCPPKFCPIRSEWPFNVSEIWNSWCYHFFCLLN